MSKKSGIGLPGFIGIRIHRQVHTITGQVSYDIRDGRRGNILHLPHLEGEANQKLFTRAVEALGLADGFAGTQAEFKRIK